MGFYRKMEQYNGKVAVITGAASGIGKALAEKLAGMGADVVLSDLNETGLTRVVDTIAARGGTASGERLDVSDYEAFKGHLQGVVAAKGRIDYLFNNAGIAISSEFRDMTIEDWHKVMDVNLNGVFHGSMVAYKQMVKQGAGHIVNLSSVEGLMPFPTTASYVASKYAVLGMSQTMWVEGRGLGVRVSAVCPGFIRTDIFDSAKMVNLDREKMKSHYGLVIRLGITPEKCADVILRGVAQNRPIIPVTGLAHIAWRIARLSPVGLMRMVSRDYDKWRDKVSTCRPDEGVN